MKYGVVIVTYNRLQLLKECLKYVQNQTRDFDVIVIVDNASKDGTHEYLQSLKSHSSKIIVIEEETNIGGAGGFSEGLKYICKYQMDYVLLIDDDALIDTNFLLNCDAYLSIHPNTIAVSGTVYTNGQIQLFHRRRILIDLLFLEGNVPEKEYRNDAFSYDLGSFCGLMVKQEIINKIGFPLSEYFIWYDDTEYSMRLRKYGKIININSASINHCTNICQSKKGFFDRMTWKNYYCHRNRIDLVRRHYGFFTHHAIYCEMIIFIICGFVMSLIPGKKTQGKFVLQLMTDALHDGTRKILNINNKYFK